MFEQSGSTRPLLPVRRERVVASPLLDPVRSSKRRCRSSASASRRSTSCVRQAARANFRAAASRRRCSPAPPRRGRRPPKRRRGNAASRRSPSTGSRVAGCPALVLDEAVAVPVAVVVDPPSAASRPPAAVKELGVAGPAPDLPEEARGRAASRRRCRSRANHVSAARRGAPRGRSCPARRRPGVVLVRLQRGERVERADASSGPSSVRLQARDRRVAAEHGHEPGHPCGGQHPDPVVVRACGAQRDRRPTAERAAQIVAARCAAAARAGATPRATSDALALLAEAVFDRRAARPRSPSATGRCLSAAPSARGASS